MAGLHAYSKNIRLDLIELNNFQGQYYLLQNKYILDFFANISIYSFIEIWASIVITETGIRDKQSGFRIPVDARDFFLLYIIPTGFEIYLAFH
jgi:hypothetical protein